MPEREMERISCPSGASSYNIYADGAFVVSAQSTSCDAQGLTDATTYSFTVTAVNAGGESSPSDPAAPIKRGRESFT